MPDEICNGQRPLIMALFSPLLCTCGIHSLTREVLWLITVHVYEGSCCNLQDLTANCHQPNKHNFINWI